MKTKLLILLSLFCLLVIVPTAAAQTSSECRDAAGALIPCPDRDGDGVQDSNDRCISDVGPATNGGCPVPVDPDTDGDGLADSSDRCPRESGPGDNGGCPVPAPADPDTDGDGLADSSDRCPSESGPGDNGGCPKQEESQPEPAQPEPTQSQPDQSDPVQPEQPQSEPAQTQPEKPNTSLPQPAAIAIPNLLSQRTRTNSACVIQAMAQATLTARKTSGKTEAGVGALDPNEIYPIYATADTEDGVWYLVQDGWVASSDVEQAGDCSSIIAIHDASGLLDIANATEEDVVALLLPAVQKVREAGARMRVQTGIQEMPGFIMDIDSEGESWMIFPAPEGGIGTIFRFNSANKPESFYAFDPAFLGGVNLAVNGSVMPLAYDPAFRGGVFVGTFYDSDTSDNPAPFGALADVFTGPIDADPTAGNADYFLKFNQETGDTLVYLIPEPGADLPPETTPLAFLFTEGRFVIADDDDTTPHTPLDRPMFFEIGPGQNPPTEAIKGTPMTIINNTSGVHGENDSTGYTFRDILISSVVYNLPPRSVAGWLVPDTATERLLFTVKDVTGTQTNGELILDERGDLVFIPEGTSAAGKVSLQDFHFALMAIPPMNNDGTDGLVIGLPQDTAKKQRGEIEILSIGWGVSQINIVLHAQGGGPHVKVFNGSTGQ